MMLRKYVRKWLVVALIIVALVPLIITAFELIFAEGKSVTFLGKYDPRVTVLVVSYYILLLGLAFFWFARQVISIAQLKNEKTKAELMLLKSQINPHFFFNTLNNLYGWIDKDPKKAQELILKLSDMMRYNLYEGDKDIVTLKEEVDYLKNYIELHKTRYQKHIAINFFCDIDESLKVVPLLFIILLENAFKHGVENLRDNAFVKLNITSVENKIAFTLENNFDVAHSKMQMPGIGLKNLRRRLELIYTNKHTLSISISENVYKAQLILSIL